MDFKRIKLDKLLLILTFLCFSAYLFLSYFLVPWTLDTNAIQIRRSSILISGLVFVGFACLMVLILYLIFTKKYPLKIFIPLLILFLFGVFWSIYAVFLENQYSTFLLRDNFPPTIMMACSFILVGYSNKYWNLIKKIIYIIAIWFIFFSFVEVIRGYLQFGFSYRITSSAPMYFFEIGLFSLYGIVLLTDDWKEKRKAFIFVLILFLIINAIILQGRTWFIHTVILLLIYLFGIRKTLKKRKGLIIIVPLLIVITLFIVFVTNKQIFEGLLNRFNSSGDTRTNQLVTFFEQVPLEKLVLGSGTRASYSFLDNVSYNYIDNQVLLFLFRYGMIPTIFYCFLTLYPVFKGITLKNKKIIYKSIVMIAWFGAMIGFSVYFNINLSILTLIVLAYCGRLFYEIDIKQKESRRN